MLSISWVVAAVVHISSSSSSLSSDLFFQLVHSSSSPSSSTTFSIYTRPSSNSTLYSFEPLLRHFSPCAEQDPSSLPRISATFIFPCANGVVIHGEEFEHFIESHNLSEPPSCGPMPDLPIMYSGAAVDLRDFNDTNELRGVVPFSGLPEASFETNSVFSLPTVRFSYTLDDSDCERTCDNGIMTIFSTTTCRAEKIEETVDDEENVVVCSFSPGSSSCPWTLSEPQLGRIEHSAYKSYLLVNNREAAVQLESPFYSQISHQCAIYLEARDLVHSMSISYRKMDQDGRAGPWRPLHNFIFPVSSSFEHRPIHIPVGAFSVPVSFAIGCGKGGQCAFKSISMKGCDDHSELHWLCPGGFLCSSHGHSSCIPRSSLCDAVVDCEDADDERDCDMPPSARCTFDDFPMIENESDICPGWTLKHQDARRPLLKVAESKKRGGYSLHYSPVLSGGSEGHEIRSTFTSPLLPRTSVRGDGNCLLHFNYCIGRKMWLDIEWTIIGELTISHPFIPETSAIGDRKEEWPLWEIPSNAPSLSQRDGCYWNKQNITIPKQLVDYRIRFIVHVVNHDLVKFEIDDIAISPACFFNDSVFDDVTAVYKLEPCNATGSRPPDDAQCTQFYNGTDQAARIRLDKNGVQKWMAPRTGQYRFEVCGAGGGNVSSEDGQMIVGGGGGCVVGIRSMVYGESIDVSVGQAGQCDNDTCSVSSGGGASLVHSKKVLWIVAAGGGGTDRRKGEHGRMSADGGDLVQDFSASGLQAAFDDWNVGDAYGYAFNWNFTPPCRPNCLKTWVHGGECPPGKEKSAPGGFGGGGAACGSDGGAGGGYLGGSLERGGGGSSFVSHLPYSVSIGLNHGPGFVRIHSCTLQCETIKTCIFVDVIGMECVCLPDVDCDRESLLSFWFRSTLVLLIVIVAIVVLFVVQAQRFRRSQRRVQKLEHMELLNRERDEENTIEGAMKTMKVPLIARDRIFIRDRIGKGAFGEVFLADIEEVTGKRYQVAIKTLPLSADNETQIDFTFETMTLNRLGHENIVRALGVNMERNPYYLILEHMAGGDLRSFLRCLRPLQEEGEGEHVNATMEDLLRMSRDVLAGCEYLEMNHHVHRDVAARNCLLTSRGPDRVVKLADFGMARDIYRMNYYRKNGRAKMPVKWLPPESYMDGTFTSKSDVWSFGILLWEVFSLGHMPYPGKSNYEVMDVVKRGRRLQPPKGTPQEIYEVMRRCWKYSASERPTFADLHAEFMQYVDDELLLAFRLPPGELVTDITVMVETPAADAEYTSLGCSEREADGEEEEEEDEEAERWRGREGGGDVVLHSLPIVIAPVDPLGVDAIIDLELD